VRVIDRSSRTGRRDARLNEFEVTLLEALEGWDRHVELRPAAALARFVALLNRDEVRIGRLIRAAATESSVVRERLRAVLAHGGWAKEADRVEAARSASSRSRALSVLPKSLR
jgi:hypothetical protein